MSPEPVTIFWLLNKAWILIVGFLWYGKKNLDRDNRERDHSITELEKSTALASSTFITEAQMKDAIREALEPYKEDQQEIKLLLRGLNDQIFALSKDMAVQNAIRSLSNDQQNNVGG